MRIELAVPGEWVTTTVVRDGREIIEVEGGLEIELGEPTARPDDPVAVLEALGSARGVDGARMERAGHVVGHTTDGVPLSLSSIKFRDATNTVVEGCLIALYDFGDCVATVCCRMRGREVLAKYGPMIEPLLASARLDRQRAAPRIDDLMT